MAEHCPGYRLPAVLEAFHPQGAPQELVLQYADSSFGLGAAFLTLGKFLVLHFLPEGCDRPRPEVIGHSHGLELLAVGGVILATAGTFVLRAVGLPELSVVDCLILGPVLCLSGVIGDLSESMLKRSFEVKDSGWIMPGHGGLLDRIDSVLFVAPMLYGWVAFVEG